MNIYGIMRLLSSNFLTPKRQYYVLSRCSYTRMPIFFSFLLAFNLYAQTGTVLEQGTNKPLQNALVTLKSSWALVLTDAQGMFDFSGTPVVYRNKSQSMINLVSLQNNKLTINIEKINTPVSISIYSMNGKKIADICKGVYNKGATTQDISQFVKAQSFNIIKISLANSTYILPLLSLSPHLFVSSSSRSPITPSPSDLKKANAATETDTLIVSKYLYTSIAQPIAATNTIYLAKPSTLVSPPGMKSIPGGSFMMGSTGTYSDSDERPVHEDTISPFFMDSTEVTQADYKAIMHVEPWVNFVPVNPGVKYPGKGNKYPVWYITWNDAVLYCNERSKRDGLDTVYSYVSRTGEFGNKCILTGIQPDFTKKGYRLPTEAEWEYAARAEITTEYYWGNKIDSTALKYAWYGISLANPAASKLPNDFGLYDMSGNVYEPVNDYYDWLWYQTNENVDPIGPNSGDQRILRGGGWNSRVYDIRSAARLQTDTDQRDYEINIGIRVVLPIR